MSERQGFFVLLFFASMLQGIVPRSNLLLRRQGILERDRFGLLKLILKKEKLQDRKKA